MRRTRPNLVRCRCDLLAQATAGSQSRVSVTLMSYSVAKMCLQNFQIVRLKKPQKMHVELKVCLSVELQSRLHMRKRTAFRVLGHPTRMPILPLLVAVKPLYIGVFECKTMAGEGTTVKWPTGDSGDCTQRVVRHVDNTGRSIGHTERAFVVQHKMTFGEVKNKASTFALPSSESFQAIAFNGSSRASDFYEALTDVVGTRCWSIAAAVFVLKPRHASEAAGFDAELQLFPWALEKGQEVAKKLAAFNCPTIC